MNNSYNRDLENAAIHEAGHVIVTRLLGGWADARLWPTYTSNQVEERTVAGRARIICEPKVFNWRPLVGMAGEVAELIHVTESTDETIVHDFENIYLSGCISKTDADLIGNDFFYADVRATYSLLKNSWVGVLQEAGFLKTTFKANIFNRLENK